MGYIVPFMNTKGGVGKSVLARAYAVAMSRAGVSVLIADVDAGTATSKRWGDQRRANGFKPGVAVQAMSARRALQIAGRADVLIVDAPAWKDRDCVRMAGFSTFCVIPTRPGRMDDLPETVRLIHVLKDAGIQDWRLGVAVNGLRAASAAQDERDARDYLAAAGVAALPGALRDLKDYEVALMEGRALGETAGKPGQEAAFVMDAIAGAVFDAGRRLQRDVRRQDERVFGRPRRSPRDDGRGGDEDAGRTPCGGFTPAADQRFAGYFRSRGGARL